jgi:hypothetical protein
MIITLPVEPDVGTVVEIVDGSNKGSRYKRIGPVVWRELRYTPSRDVHWSWIWWAVCEDGAGGTSVRVIPPDPHPLPWRTVPIGAGVVQVRDAGNEVVCEISPATGGFGSGVETSVRICNAVNAAGNAS